MPHHDIEYVLGTSPEALAKLPVIMAMAGVVVCMARDNQRVVVPTEKPDNSHTFNPSAVSNAARAAELMLLADREGNDKVLLIASSRSHHGSLDAIASLTDIYDALDVPASKRRCVAAAQRVPRSRMIEEGKSIDTVSSIAYSAA